MLSAFFSGMEIAFVSSDKLRLEVDRKEKGFTSAILGMLFRKPDEFVTTLLVGNNVVLVVYGLLMAKLLEKPLESFLHNDALVLLIQSLLSTVIILVTGEFLPKVLFRSKSYQMVKIFAFPVSIFYVILFPVTKLCKLLTKLFFLCTGSNIKREDKLLRFSTADLDHYLSENLNENPDEVGELDTEVKIIQNALEFSKVQVRECMVPRNEIEAVDVDENQSVLEEKFKESGLSKLIVYRENIDDVIGYIHSSEMFKDGPWQDKVVKTMFVPESMFANKLMTHLMQKNKSVAIVIDELGGTSGMVTLEDIVEEIFGEIEDEHDRSKLVSRKVDDETYIFSGRVEIDDINEKYGLDLPENDDYLTIAGFILDNYQHIPRAGEKVDIPPFKFDILRSSSTKIELVRMTIMPHEDEED